VCLSLHLDKPDIHDIHSQSLLNADNWPGNPGLITITITLTITITITITITTTTTTITITITQHLLLILRFFYENSHIPAS